MTTVLVEEQADAAEVEAIRELLRELGLTATVTPQLGRYGGGPAPWAMAIEVGDPAFYRQLAAAQGTDPAAALAQLVARVYELRRRPDRPDGSIRIEDGGRTIGLTQEVSDEGLRRVAAGELAPGASYFWDDGDWTGI